MEKMSREVDQWAGPPGFANWHTLVLGSCPPAQTGRQELCLVVLIKQSVHSLWSLRAFPGGDLRGTGSSQGCGIELLEIILEFVQVSRCWCVNKIVCPKSLQSL